MVILMRRSGTMIRSGAARFVSTWVTCKRLDILWAAAAYTAKKRDILNVVG